MRPKSDKPELPDVLPKFVAYFIANDNDWGPHLHCMLEDGNVEGDCTYELQLARSAGDQDCVELCELLMRMSKSQRGRINRLVHETLKRFAERTQQ